MKKFFVSLIFLVIAAGVVFYFGWVQLQLPPDTYAVAFSRTGGWENDVMEPGKFIWRWERLIPTNFTLYKYTLPPQEHDLQSTGTLPSGAVYAQFLPGNPDFSYTIDVAISYRLKPEELPRMTRDGVVTPATIDTWYKTFDANVLAQAQSMLAPLVNTEVSGSSAFSFAGIADTLLKELSRKYPDVTFLSVAPRQLKFPDLALYERARKAYDTIAQARTQSLESATRASAPDQVQKGNQLEMLKQYGELLNEYPILLKYLAIEAGKNPDTVKLDNLTIPQPKGQ